MSQARTSKPILRLCAKPCVLRGSLAKSCARSFPGYVFVEVPEDRETWRILLATYGVRTPICNGHEPSRLDAAFIDALRGREREGVITAPPNS